MLKAQIRDLKIGDLFLFTTEHLGFASYKRTKNELFTFNSNHFVNLGDTGIILSLEEDILDLTPYTILTKGYVTTIFLNHKISYPVELIS